MESHTPAISPVALPSQLTVGALYDVVDGALRASAQLLPDVAELFERLTARLHRTGRGVGDVAVGRLVVLNMKHRLQPDRTVN